MSRQGLLRRLLDVSGASSRYEEIIDVVLDELERELDVKVECGTIGHNGKTWFVGKGLRPRTIEEVRKALRDMRR